MKYLLVALIAVAVAFGFMIKHSNDKRAEIEAQAEAHKQKLEQERINAIKSEADRQAEKQQKAQYYAQLAANAKSGGQQLNSASVTVDGKNEDIIKIENKVKESLKDPMSAMFRNQKGNCGEFNAKNSFGGYNGFKRYIYRPNDDYLIMESSNDKDIFTSDIVDSLWKGYCT